jgi:hypothetical protein
MRSLFDRVSASQPVRATVERLGGSIARNKNDLQQLPDDTLWLFSRVIFAHAI